VYVRAKYMAKVLHELIMGEGGCNHPDIYMAWKEPEL